MRSLFEAAGADLEWSRPQILGRSYELLAGDEVIGALRMTGFLRIAAEAETGDGSWAFKPTGFLGRRVEIRNSGDGALVANYVHGWWHRGWLEFASGARYRWTVDGFLMRRWRFESDDGSPIVHLIHRFSFLRSRAAVEIEPAAARIPELPLMITFGWYLMVMLSRSSRGST